ncbi:terminase small subunit [Thalassovita sp.]|uniref:terminase small subunit n=1 Tax=Thalassovita sp. TaxID=1979401 RepID=UPI002AB2613B|nr:terminase small subunit [Thalassovita sp.]
MAKTDWVKRQAFAEAYVRCGNASKAARMAGVPQGSAHSMGYKWLRDVGVVEMIRSAMNDELKALGPSAITVLRDLMASDATPASVRLQAARDVLDRTGWTAPKRPEPVEQSQERPLIEMSRYELETLVSGHPGVMLDQPSLDQLVAEQSGQEP